LRHLPHRTPGPLLATLLLLSAALSAEEWTPVRSFRTFSKSTFRGLPQSSVVTLEQDSDGVLWIGTLDGAASFDGQNVTPVPAIPGSPARGVISAIVALRKGGVAIGSPAGVHLFDGRAWRLDASERAVAALAESRDGTLWMSDTEGTLFTLGKNGSWDRHREVGDSITELATGADGVVWAGTPTGAVRLEGAKPEPIPGPPIPGRPGALLVARDGRVWAATLTGAVYWARRGEEGWHRAPFESWPRGAFRCIAEDRRGRIWAGSFGGGVAFGTADGPWTIWGPENGPLEAGVMSILGDREGSVWFGLNAVGLAQWVGEEWSHRVNLDLGRSRRQLFSAFGLARGANGRDVLVSAFNSGAIRLSDSGVRAFATPEGITEDVRSFVEPEPGTLWAGTRFGIFESRSGAPFKKTLALENGFVMGIFGSPDGRWYACTSTKGVFEHAGNEWRPANAINAALEDVHARSIAWTRSGEMWVSTIRGVAVFKDGGPPQRLTSATVSALPESVNAVVELANGDVWVGGTGGIAVRSGGAWRRLTQADGVPGQTVYSLARAADGSVWVGGSAGVGRWRDGRFTVWDSRSGLLQEECNLNGMLVEPDGSAFVGTMGGLARFDPHVTPLPAPPLRLVWRKAPPKEADGLAHIPAKDRALHLRWGAAWLGPHAVQYRVRVPRLRDDWSAPSGEDHLDVENLGPGAWNVEVEARVEGTNAWTAPLTLDFAVAPLWHETLAARAGLIALLGLAAYGLVRLRLNALRRHAAALEETVKARTQELAEKVVLLQDSESRALAASRAKSSFLANMSHELRTPLNGILGFAQLLARREGRGPEDREGLSVILKSGEHLLGLINDVLSLSKIEAGRVTLDAAPFDLAALVRDVEDVLRLRADAKGLALRCELGEALPRAVRGDEGRLRQVLTNLVGNAVKFTEKGGVTLRASWTDGRARFEVADTGPGIDAAEMASLFEPFVQTETGRRSKEGTGLGLALSRDLARLMGGDVTVTSAKGKGSTFVVDIALPEAPADALASRDRRRVASLAPGQDVKVLVVDDVALNRTVLARLLASVGFRVEEAASGEETLEKRRSFRPDLIWMDKRMPGLDGLETTRRIRAEEARTGERRVKIVALSASALEHERGAILEAGCDDFVAKPFREATVFETMRRHLGVTYLYDSSERRAAPAAPKESRVAASGNVLLVDDDWVCREVAQELLRAKGVTVTTATSGNEALELVRNGRFDLVFMDLHMPDMDGVEVARRIKADPSTSRLPIVAMTAESWDDAREALDGVALDGYVGKPVESAALGAVLDQWLRRAPTGSRPSERPPGTAGLS
jgi:signal transduction histidine kinase/CheY-like chemotaxis protein/ligand-binding sensor domain-containing protein